MKEGTPMKHFLFIMLFVFASGCSTVGHLRNPIASCNWYTTISPEFYESYASYVSASRTPRQHSEDLTTSEIGRRIYRREALCPGMVKTILAGSYPYRCYPHAKQPRASNYKVGRAVIRLEKACRQFFML